MSNKLFPNSHHEVGMANFRAACFCWVALVLGTGVLPAQTSMPTPSAAGHPYEIADGTTFLIRLGQRLETRTARPGQHFKASLAEDLVAPNGAVLPRGSRVRGHISRTSQGLHPRLLLSFDGIETQHGWDPLLATVTGIPGEHGAKENDGTIEAASHPSTPSDEPRSPWSRVTGVAGLFADHSVRLEKGTILEVRLDHPLQLSRR
jgi:hypothetical protein